MKWRHVLTKISRLNLTAAAREAATLKAQFRREDEELYRQGRGDEVLADRRKNLGIAPDGKTELVTVNGVRIGQRSGSASEAVRDGSQPAASSAGNP